MSVLDEATIRRRVIPVLDDIKRIRDGGGENLNNGGGEGNGCSIKY